MLLSELDYTNYTMLLVSAKNQILKDINIYYKIFFNNKMVIFYLSFHVEDKSWHNGKRNAQKIIWS